MFAIDTTSKLIPSFLTGPRDLKTATAFAVDLRKRILGKPQISVDGWPHWPEAFRRAFGWSGCNLGACIKEYQSDADPADPDRKYSPSRVKSIEKRALLGVPVEDAISTSIAERSNLTSRMHMRRLTRLTNAYSKKRENLVAAIGLHFMHYNFVRVHEAVKTTPAVAAGIVAAPWSLAELVTAALAVAAEEPEAPPPAPAGPAPSPGPQGPLPTWETWTEPEQIPLPGVDAANDNATPADDDEEAPPTVRDPVPFALAD
jgi:IS1 family transposase